jgi:hypothetical protein
MADDRARGWHLTPNQLAKIEREERELPEGWIKRLSSEEAEAWMDAHEDDLERRIESMIQAKADFVAIRQAIAGTIQEHAIMEVEEALEVIRSKGQRTLVEAEALDALERIKNKLLRREGRKP